MIDWLPMEIVSPKGDDSTPEGDAIIDMIVLEVIRVQQLKYLESYNNQQCTKCGENTTKRETSQ